MGQGYGGGQGGLEKFGKRKLFRTYCIVHHRGIFVTFTPIVLVLYL